MILWSLARPTQEKLLKSKSFFKDTATSQARPLMMISLHSSSPRTHLTM
ncbi:hypothetical protein LINPERHAP1_LOCUS4950 [Linum perenne]